MNDSKVKKSIALEISVIVLIVALAVVGLVYLSSKMMVSPNGNEERPLEVTETVE